MTTKGPTGRKSTLAEAQAAAKCFLQEALPDTHYVEIVKVVRLQSDDAMWEVGAVVWQPDATIQSPDDATRHPMPDQKLHVVRMDDQLNVTRYETPETAGQQA